MRTGYVGLAASVALSLGAGCSFASVTEVPDHPERLAYFDCSSSRLAPVADSAAGTVAIGMGAAAVLDSGENDVKRTQMSTAIFVGLAGVAIASAVYGFTETTECADAKTALAVRIQQQQELRQREEQRQRELQQTEPAAPDLSAQPVPPPSRLAATNTYR
jgi:hypothetical protein